MGNLLVDKKKYNLNSGNCSFYNNYIFLDYLCYSNNKGRVK